MFLREIFKMACRLPEARPVSKAGLATWPVSGAFQCFVTTVQFERGLLSQSITGIIHTVKLDTIVTTKGTTTIPEPYRKELGISTGTVISWEVQGSKLVGMKKAGAENALQAHIRRYSGAWKGASSLQSQSQSQCVETRLRRRVSTRGV